MSSGGSGNDVTDEDVDRLLNYFANLLSNESGSGLAKLIRLFVFWGFLYSVGKKMHEKGLDFREAVKEVIREGRQANAKDVDRRLAKDLLALSGLFVSTWSIGLVNTFGKDAPEEDKKQVIESALRLREEALKLLEEDDKGNSTKNTGESEHSQDSPPP